MMGGKKKEEEGEQQIAAPPDEGAIPPPLLPRQRQYVRETLRLCFANGYLAYPDRFPAHGRYWQHFLRCQQKKEYTALVFFVRKYLAMAERCVPHMPNPHEQERLVIHLEQMLTEEEEMVPHLLSYLFAPFPPRTGGVA